MSQALYRKYRSKSLADIVGQEHITDILSRALKAHKIAHAYLFTGPRGVGKTSIARILAHEINQLPYIDDTPHLDIIEIDAASNNGVDDVRLLREKAQIAPVSAAKKVYIIDEVHMLSKPAFNALLKTLEEPPEHIVFILATTDVDKLPSTIISRTQRYHFRTIGLDTLKTHLRFIANEENIKISDEALQLIAERGDGSFRDAISILDQLSSLADTKEGITTELVETSLGLAPATMIHELLTGINAHDIKQVATTLSRAESEGVSAQALSLQLIHTLRTQVVDTPSVLVLLDALLDVTKSSQPYIKLLSVLGKAAAQGQKPKNAALLAPQLEISATVDQLRGPVAKIKAQPAQTNAPDAQAKQEMPKKRPKQHTQETPITHKPAISAPAHPFDWQALLTHTHDTSIAVYTVLSKCEYEHAGDTLTLYAGNAFYKKKLDDPKYHTYLYESLQAIGSYQLTVHTLPTRAPMKNSQAAAIAAMMGGGTEVPVDAVL